MKIRQSGMVIVILVILFLGSWLVNFVKLTRCDFESPWKCEVVHGIGLFPPIQVISVWFGTDEE